QACTHTMNRQDRSNEDRRQAQRYTDNEKSAKKRLTGFVEGGEMLLVSLFGNPLFFFPCPPFFGRPRSDNDRCNHNALSFWQRLIRIDAEIDQHWIKYRDAEYNRELMDHWIERLHVDIIAMMTRDCN